MNKSQQIKFNKFKEEVLKYKSININELYMILNRLTWSDKKQYFGYSKDSRFNARLKYHRFFIKMLESQRIIEQDPKYIQVWTIK